MGDPDLREHEKRYQSKKLDFTVSGIIGYCLSAVYRRNKLDFVAYLYFDDRRPRTSQYYISNKDFTNHITLIFASGGAFGTGLGELIVELLKR